VGEANLYHIRNRNELRVIEELPGVLREYEEYQPEILDIEDIYALALNKLPARYVQRGSIVLSESVSDEMVRDALRQAVNTVRERPNY
jgi:hypothetical protein